MIIAARNIIRASISKKPKCIYIYNMLEFLLQEILSCVDNITRNKS